MQLPFTKEQFFDLLAVYNVGLWPALLALWIASVLVSVLLLSSRRPPDRWISALLAAHWAWSAMAYHVGFFTRINQAAWGFAALFLLQAVVFFWAGVGDGRVARPFGFAPHRSERAAFPHSAPPEVGPNHPARASRVWRMRARGRGKRASHWLNRSHVSPRWLRRRSARNHPRRTSS